MVCPGSRGAGDPGRIAFFEAQEDAGVQVFGLLAGMQDVIFIAFSLMVRGLRRSLLIPEPARHQTENCGAAKQAGVPLSVRCHAILA